MMMKTAYVIGRFSPPHKGHINIFLWLLTKYDRIIIGIGSCYEVGTFRHPLLAFLREKMICWSLVDAGVDMSRVTFVHLQDFHNDWDGWWKHVTGIPGIKDVDTLVTGNFEQIISEIEARKISLPFNLINPEKEMPDEWKFPYHATDLRNAIIAKDYWMFFQIAATGTIRLMRYVGGFTGIKRSIDGYGENFIPGRQTVDLIVTCRDKDVPHKRLVICGYRKMEKENFPGYLAIPGGAINPYENPMDAAVREFKEETGLDVLITNRHTEPVQVKVGGYMPVDGEMHFVKLISTDNPELGGNQGGSSQLFCIHLNCDQRQFDGYTRSFSDLEAVEARLIEFALSKGLAYQQNWMVKEAMKFA